MSSTPFRIIEIVGRTTFWDVRRATPQPINTAGIRLTESFDGNVAAERLIPWEGHSKWAPMPNKVQQPLNQNFKLNLPLMHSSFVKLGKALGSQKA